MSGKAKFLAALLLAALVLLGEFFPKANATRALRAQEAQSGNAGEFPREAHRNPADQPFPPDFSEKQKKMILEENLDKSRKDAEEMASLAHEFQKELEHQESGALSPDMALQLEKIGRLAKKIRGELGGF